MSCMTRDRREWQNWTNEDLQSKFRSLKVHKNREKVRRRRKTLFIKFFIYKYCENNIDKNVFRRKTFLL